MLNKKETTPEGAENKHKYDNTKSMVLSMLTTKPQSRYTLAGAIGISEREFRKAVRDLRNEGYLIIAGATGGYGLATKAEARHYIKSLYSRAYDLLRTAKAMEGINPEQITMEDILNDVVR